MSIGVARYDMVVVSKPSMAAVCVCEGQAHSRRRRVGDEQSAVGRRWAWR